MKSTLGAILLFMGLPLFVYLQSCVPAREFKELDQKYAGLKDHAAVLEHTNDTLSASLKEQRAVNAALSARNQALLRGIDSVEGDLRYLQESNARLRNDYNDLENLHKNLLAGNQKETGRLLAEIQKNQSQLQEREDALKELERQLYQRRQDQEREAKRQEEDRKVLDSLRLSLSVLAENIEKKNADIAALQKAIAQRDSVSEALRQRVAGAMFGFEGKGLSVYQKGGRVYVSLEEQLLFKQGSYDVDAKGREAILALGKVLAANPDIHVEVEGHTDDVPMKGTGQVKDNWDLSVMRATSIVRLLTQQGKVDPKRVTAAGRGEYIPLDAAKTAEARKKNRRTEVILIPKVETLLDLVGGKK